MLDASRSSLQTGLGAQAVGAGSPAVPGIAAEFHASDAIFQPQIAGHAASAHGVAVVATSNDTLLATALAYLDLLRANQQLRIAEETRDNAQRLADLTATFAGTGQGPQADADRAQTEHVRRRLDVSRARESTLVATARLAERLSLDPSMEIKPLELTVVPIDLVSYELPAAELVATGLVNRQNWRRHSTWCVKLSTAIAANNTHRCCQACCWASAKAASGAGADPTSTILAGASILTRSSTGNSATSALAKGPSEMKRGRGTIRLLALQVGMMDRVAREIVEGHAQVKARKGQIEVAESGVKSATDSYERNVARIREGQGLPIEVLQSLQALDEARREYLRTLADYNEAQFGSSVQLAGLSTEDTAFTRGG